MSEGNANSLNFFDMNRTPVNAGAPQQPPDQSARTPSNSNDFKNTQSSAESLRPHLPDSQSGGVSLNPPQQPAASTISSQPPPKDPTSLGVNQRDIEFPTPEHQIRHIKDLLLNLKIRIASCETHARQQGIKREEIWTKFELDRMRIESHQVPDRRLGDHWKVIIENKVRFETLQLKLTGAFDSNADLVRAQAGVRDAEDTLARLYRQRWMLTSELTMLEMQVQTAMIDEALRRVGSRR